jgi:putative PIN family toxin of toxin-antitoxin system
MAEEKPLVIDTSTLISAFFFPQSVPAQALRKGLREYMLWVSVETQQELLEVAQRDKFDRYVPLQTRMERVTDFLAKTRLCADVPFIETGCRDPKDSKFLTLAVAVGADILVSSDSDLLDLSPFQSVRVMKPAEFCGH